MSEVRNFLPSDLGTEVVNIRGGIFFLFSATKHGGFSKGFYAGLANRPIKCTSESLFVREHVYDPSPIGANYDEQLMHGQCT